MKKTLSIIIGILLIIVVIGAVIAYSNNKSKKSEEQKALQSANQASMNMSKERTSADVDRDFINNMIAHHLGAIEMAKQAQVKSPREEVKTIAKAIIQVQQKEVDQLYVWKKDWYKDEAKVVVPTVEDLGAGNNEFDLAFINAMIPHHKEGIKMAEDIMKVSTRQEILSLADSIKTTQVKEVQKMEEWRTQWFEKKIW